MIYVDRRLGGQSRYVLTDKPEKLMDIPQHIKKSVAFVAINENERYTFIGTAFFVSEHPKHPHGHVFAVTAKHVFERMVKFEEVYLRVNLIDGTSAWVTTTVSDWICHPTEEDSVDIAVIRFPFREEFDHKAFPLFSAATAQIMQSYGWTAGRPVFLAGLFRRLPGYKKNIPIIRVGNIAALPEEKIETTKTFKPMDAYLVEVHSLKGLSGSPVFIYLEETDHRGFTKNVESLLNDMRPTRPLTNVRLYLLGLVHGHWDTNKLDVDASEDTLIGDDDLNTGIAIVVPAQKLIETLNHPRILSENERIESERHPRATLDGGLN